MKIFWLLRKVSESISIACIGEYKYCRPITLTGGRFIFIELFLKFVGLKLRKMDSGATANTAVRSVAVVIPHQHA
jgi:hypothetical protein